MKWVICFLLFLFSMSAISRVQTCKDLHDSLMVGLFSQDECLRIPYVEEGYIPGGIHVTGKGIGYISMYHKDARGDTTQNSIIAEINIKTKSVKRYIFPNKEQYDGLVVYNNYKKFVVPNGLEFCIFTKRGFMKRPRCQIQDIGSSKRINRFTFLYYGKDHKDKWHIWAGQFEDGKASEDGMHIFGYEIIKGKINKKPSYRFYVPPRVTNVRGISVFPKKQRKVGYNKIIKEEYSVILSTAKADDSSKIYSINYKKHKPYYYKFKIDESSINSLYTAPHGIKELHAINSTKSVWTVLESGTPFFEKKYQKDGLPFLFKIPYSQLDL